MSALAPMPPYSSSAKRREDPVLAEELDDVPRELGRRVDLGRPRRDPLARERAHELPDLALLVGQHVVRHGLQSRFPGVILENGLVRTMDPQIPTQRALAIAGERIAGGVGVHETALASPGGGRPRRPRRRARASATRTSTSRPGRSHRREVTLDGCASLDEALARIAAPRAGAGRL